MLWHAAVQIIYGTCSKLRNPSAFTTMLLYSTCYAEAKAVFPLLEHVAVPSASVKESCCSCHDCCQ